MQPQKKGTGVQVRASKFRHLFGTPNPQTECMNSVSLGSLQMEANLLKANAKWIAVPWVVPGSVGIIPLATKGAVNSELPLIFHDEITVNEFNFNPFHDDLLATATSEGTALIWKIPEGGLTQTLTTPATTLKASDKRLLNVEFHPLADNVLVTIDAAKQVKIFDVATQTEKLTLPDVHKALLTNVAWNGNGNLLATSAKDHFVRIFDPRANSLVSEAPDHPGAKGARVAWLYNKDLVFSVGFGKGSERQFSLHDPRNLAHPLTNQAIDASSSTLLPFIDQDLNIIYLAGKGDGNIRFYEVDDANEVHFLSEFKSKDPQSGIYPLPKLILDSTHCEVMRFLKLTPQGHIIPIKFEVPRQHADVAFQEDIFPETFDGKPSCSSAEWFGGVNKPGGKASMKK